MSGPDYRVDLPSLFERTREDPNPISMQRMLARSREIPPPPESSKRSAVWALGLLVGCALLATRTFDEKVVEPSAPHALSAPPPRGESRGAESVEIEAEGSLTNPTVRVAQAQSDELWPLDGGETDVFDDLAFDPGNLATQDLEAWVAAASQTISDG